MISTTCNLGKLVLVLKASRATNKKGFHTMRDLRCLCSGTDERAEYKTKKTGCKAMIGC